MAQNILQQCGLIITTMPVNKHTTATKHPTKLFTWVHLMIHPKWEDQV